MREKEGARETRTVKETEGAKEIGGETGRDRARWREGDWMGERGREGEKAGERGVIEGERRGEKWNFGLFQTDVSFFLYFKQKRKYQKY